MTSTATLPSLEIPLNYSHNKAMVLEAKNLHVDVQLPSGLSCVLRDISFQLQAGKTLGLVGESGAGKSMLGRIISRQLPANFAVSSGQLSFAGQDLLNASAAKHRELLGDRIAFIPQEPMTALNPVLTIGQQFTEHLLRVGVALKDCREQMITALTEVMLSTPAALLDKYAFQLSGGMCQRVMIAMAFASKPDLVIADEATTALDAASQAQVVRLLQKMQRKEGTAVLFVTHDMGLATHVCDDVAVLYAGEIMENLKASELFQSPRHPYTQALKAATPSLTGPLLPLKTLEGQMPGVEIFPQLSGCRFVDRCELGSEQCSQKVPTQVNVAADHTVRCIKISESPLTPVPVVSATSSHNPGKAFSNKPIMTASNLSKTYQTKGNKQSATQALASMNLSISPGEFIGIVGGSGSGKSTLAKLIMGLETPSSGSIQLNGNILGNDKLSWKKRISLIQMIFQDARSALNPRRKVMKLLTQAMDRGVYRPSVRKNRASELAKDVGLSAQALLRYPSQLSGGQRQRVNIGRSLCDVPQILIADEIVSGLDVSVQAQIMNLLLRLRQEHKFALMLISHDLSVVRYLCDKIIVMHNGKIVEQGNTQQVLDNPQNTYTRKLIEAIPPTDHQAIWPPIETNVSAVKTV